MRAVVQRVKEARVAVSGETVGAIGRGFLVLLGVGAEDTDKDATDLARKIANLRIFPDDADKMNLSLLDVGAEMLIVSQFTLWGDCRQGRRPSFTSAAPAEKARPLYEHFLREVRALGVKTAEGRFGEIMAVSLVNDGPVTMLLDSRGLF
ncbi:MAG: D-aminoacyl-tRNA deacylase [Planctomycetota bacterium]